MADVVPQSPLAGGFVHNDWLGQLTNLATVQRLSETLVPVQEMMNFQRRVRDVLVLLSAGVGQKAIVTGVVPINESWRLMYASFRHDDSGSHTISFRYNADRPSPINVLIWQDRVVGGQEMPMYPSSFEPVVDAEDRVRPKAPEPVVWMPGDTITIVDNDVAIDPTVEWEFALRYEVRPAMARYENDTIFTGQTF